MNNKPMFIVAILSLCFLNNPIWASSRDVGDYKIETILKSNNQYRSAIEVSIKKDDHHTEIINLRIDGKGDFAGYKNVVWTSEAQIQDTPKDVLVLNSVTTVFSQNEMIFQSRKNYNYTNKIATIEITNKQKKLSFKKEFQIKGPICDDVTLVYVLNSILHLDKGMKIPKFYLLTDEPRLYHVMVKYRGDEVISSAQGEINAIKYQLMADLGALTETASRIVPPTYIWYSKANNDWVKYEGMETGYKTVNIVATKK